jgi:hypothetical protein
MAQSNLYDPLSPLDLKKAISAAIIITSKFSLSSHFQSISRLIPELHVSVNETWYFNQVNQVSGATLAVSVPDVSKTPTK